MQHRDLLSAHPSGLPAATGLIRAAGWIAHKVRRRWIALAILVLGLLGSALAGWLVMRAIEDDAVRRFAAACDAITLKIEERLTAYAVLLQGGQALFAASASVERDEWRDYVATVKADQIVPGCEGLGFSQLIAPEDLAAHHDAVRREGFPSYTVHPPGPRDVYSSIVFLEPFSGRNLLAFGYDMFSEPVRREAMTQARDTGRPALSGKVTLVQEGAADRAQAGTLMYVPVYRNDAPLDTLEERQAALLGWVYSPYRMEDLMRGTIPDWTVKGRSFVDLHIYDGDLPDNTHLLFDSQPEGEHRGRRTVLHEERTIDFYGQRWRLVFNGSRTAGEINYAPVWLTTAGGLVITGLLLGLLLALFKTADARHTAENLAEQIRGMAYHDTLTTLPNRHLLRDRLDMALAAGRRQNSLGALMLLDLDNFKPLNDEHGHAAGDTLLKEVARRLDHCIRDTDTVARLGGDEFIILLPALDQDPDAARQYATEVAENIRHCLEEPYHLDPDATGRDIAHRCSCSIGVTLFSGRETQQSHLIQRADAAMYQAKQQGRNRIAFSQINPAHPA